VKDEVSEYVEKQCSPQKEILRRTRKLFLKTLPGCKEEMRWGVPVFADGKFYAAAVKKGVNVGFAVKGLSKSESALFEGGGKTMKHVKINSLDDFDEKKLEKLIKLVNEKAVCSPGC